MNYRLTLTLAVLSLGFATLGWGDDPPAPKKYALLVGVARYEHADMNRPQPLEYPEADAKALGAALKKSGYQVVYLLGTDATKEKIDAALADLKKQGNDSGAILLGFFGHGVEYTRDKGGEEIVESYFCPYDVELRSATDSKGNVLKRGDGEGDLVEPDPTTSISMTRVFDSLKLSKAGRRVVIADCCRNDPNAARGRSFGANVKVSDLPPQTAVLFACSSGEKAYEDVANGHGVFTDEILKRINTARGEPLTAASLAESLERRVHDRVRQLTKGRQRQTPRYLSFGTVDLLLDPPALFNFADVQKSAEEAQASQAAWASYLDLEVEMTAPLGIKLRLIPPGEFMMGRTETVESLKQAFPNATEEDVEAVQDETAHRVRLTEPFWLSPTEVTVGQFKKFVEATGYVTDAEQVDPDSEENGGEGWDEETGGLKGPDVRFNWKNVGFPQDDNHPVLNVSWDDAQAYVEWLNENHGEGWRLPTEAEWEYACKAGTNTRFHGGDDPKGLTMYANVADSTLRAKVKDEDEEAIAAYLDVADGHAFTAPVGSYAQSNYFGLFDMHGNAGEWCADLYAKYKTSSKVVVNPVRHVGDGERVFRGGSWAAFPGYVRSVYREAAGPEMFNSQSGFRLARTP